MVVLRVCVGVRVSTVGQDRTADQCWVVEALDIELCCILVRVAGMGAWWWLGAGGGGDMGMGWGGHVEEGGQAAGVYTHLAARYGVHGETTGQRNVRL